MYKLNKIRNECLITYPGTYFATKHAKKYNIYFASNKGRMLETTA